MKYHIFDAAVLLTIIATARIIIGGKNVSSLAPECPDDITYSATNQTYVSSQEERRQLMPEVEVDEHPQAQVPSQMNTHAAAQEQASLSSEAEDDELDLPSSPRTPVPDPQPKDSHLRIGNLVELYGSDSLFAAPAIIKGHSDNDDNDDVYQVQHVITNIGRTSHIPSQYLHPYQPYEIGTKVSCSIGAPGKIELTPCMVLAKVIKKTSWFISYKVEYFDSRENGKYHLEYLPFSRVQRYRKENR